PGGFSRTLQDGPGGGRVSVPNVYAWHYNGPSGKYIDFFRAGFRNQVGASVGIIALGHLARIGPITRVYAVKFHFAPQTCAFFQIEAIGVSSQDMVKIAHGLVAKSQ